MGVFPFMVGAIVGAYVAQNYYVPSIRRFAHCHAYRHYPMMGHDNIDGERFGDNHMVRRHIDSPERFWDKYTVRHRDNGERFWDNHKVRCHDDGRERFWDNHMVTHYDEERVGNYARAGQHDRERFRSSSPPSASPSTPRHEEETYGKRFHDEENRTSTAD